MNAPATIVLVGPPGAGKSTLARRLARALATTHTDTDDLIAARYHKPCGEVFAELGEAAFREIEERLVYDALTGGGVVSLGGGAVTRAGVRERLAEHAVVWVDVSAEEGAARTQAEDNRPILASADGDSVGRYRELLDAREEFYREVAHIHVRTDHRLPAQVVTEILAALETLEEPGTPHEQSCASNAAIESPDPDAGLARIVEVTGARPYQVVIGHELSERILARAVELGASKVGVVYQRPLETAAQRLRDVGSDRGLQVVLLPIAEAESAKTLTQCGQLWDRLGEDAFGRTDALVGLGGGAATDLAGFVAATWMRGIPIIQVPTTLLAMVDAAVGGKTGINTSAGKNLVGAFHEPVGVFIDVEFLRTLPRKELVAGSAEIVKSGFIADERILEIVEADPERALDVDGTLPELIRRAVAVKAQVVSEDLRESGLRELLNYGHTFGHAVEYNERFRWRHGDAVAVGMMYAAELACARGVIDRGLVRRHEQILRSLGLPTTYSSDSWSALRQAMGLDKKTRGGVLRFVVLDGEVGTVTRIEGPSEAELEAAWRAIHPVEQCEADAPSDDYAKAEEG